MARFLKQQFTSLPYPTQNFTGKTVIVTGSNTGLGKEAARHIARLGAANDRMWQRRR
jgi:retinol dehydrogenase-12